MSNAKKKTITVINGKIGDKFLVDVDILCSHDRYTFCNIANRIEFEMLVYGNRDVWNAYEFIQVSYHDDNSKLKNAIKEHCICKDIKKYNYIFENVEFDEYAKNVRYNSLTEEEKASLTEEEKAYFSITEIMETTEETKETKTMETTETKTEEFDVYAICKKIMSNSKVEIFKPMTEKQKRNVKNISKTLNLNNSTDKLINKYRKVTTVSNNDKELEIHRVIIDLLTSHNDNKGYQFTVSTVRKAFYNNGIVTQKQQSKNLEKLLNGKTVKHSKDILGSTDWINDDVISKVVGRISVDVNNEFNLAIIPNSNGDYQYRRISNDIEFFYLDNKKTETTETTEIQKMLKIAERDEFGISNNTDSDDLYNLIKSLVSTYNDNNEKKINIAIM